MGNEKVPTEILNQYKKYTHKLYMIKISDENECFFKIGISKNKYSRFYQIMKVYPNITIVFEALDIDWGDAINAERYLHKIYDPVWYRPNKKFGGYLECFSNIELNTFKKNFIKVIDYNFTYIENMEITWR